jgi:hypothetical protein
LTPTITNYRTTLRLETNRRRRMVRAMRAITPRRCASLARSTRSPTHRARPHAPSAQMQHGLQARWDSRSVRQCRRRRPRRCPRQGWGTAAIPRAVPRENSVTSPKCLMNVNHVALAGTATSTMPSGPRTTARSPHAIRAPSTPLQTTRKRPLARLVPWDFTLRGKWGRHRV